MTTIPVQIQLTEETRRHIKSEAAKRGLSMGSLITELFETQKDPERAAALKKYNASAALQDEFGDFESYAGYLKYEKSRKG